MSKQEWKFRGKCKSTGNWVYGSLITMNDGVWIIPQSYDCVAISEKPDGSYLINGMIEIYRDSVGLWTGLKDKNGVEIYEGDFICWCAYGDILSDGTIYFSDGCFRVNSDSDGFAGNPCLGFIKTMPCHVIDNLTDNPELLEGN